MAEIGLRNAGLESKIRISSSLEQHAEWLDSYVELGFDRVYVHNVGRNQGQFIEDFGREVLPKLGQRADATQTGSGAS